MKASRLGVVMGVVACAATVGMGAVVSLDFEGLGDLEPVMQYYNGGLGGYGSGPGVNYGIDFVGNALAIIDADAGGSGNFGGEPSPDTVMFFLDGPAATMNVAAGFVDGFSFYYSAIGQPGFVTVWDGLNGTGNQLASLQLGLTPWNGAPDPNGYFSPLVPIGVSFSGTAYSVDFGGTVNQIGFDNVTFGSEIPDDGTDVPDAGSTMMLLGLGVAGLAYLKRR